MQKFTKEEKEIIMIGFKLYKVQIKKMMKSSESLNAGNKEIKLKFLATENLIGKMIQE